jgi:hypothetical protein
MNQDTAPKSGATTASLVLGILAVIPCCWNWLGVIFGVLAIILYFVGRNDAMQKGLRDSKAGLICGIIGLVISIVIIIFANSMKSTIPDGLRSFFNSIEMSEEDRDELNQIFEKFKSEIGNE